MVEKRSLYTQDGLQLDRPCLLVLCPLFWTKLPPLGLAYLENYLIANGVAVDVLDLNIRLYNTVSASLKKKWQRAHDKAFCESLFDQLETDHFERVSKVVDDICSLSYGVIGFSVFRSNYDFSYRLAEKIKEKSPAARIVFGGPEIMSRRGDAAWMNDLRMSGVVDAVVIGEGENALLDLVRDAKAQPFQIVGAQRSSLDDLGFPRYDGFELGSYERRRALPLFTSRGCVRRCAFCAERLLFDLFRSRSAEHIVEEIEWQKEQHNVVWFTFHDSLVNGDLAVLKRMCELIIERGLDIKWEAQVAIRKDMDCESIRLMKEAGCFNFFIGLESGSDAVLARLNKGYTTDEAHDFFVRCDQARMHFEISLIVASPDESDEEFQETLSFLRINKELIPKIAQINPFMALPGTPYDRGTSQPMIPDPERGSMRVRQSITFLEENNFTYTPHFINNLAYENG